MKKVLFIMFIMIAQPVQASWFYTIKSQREGQGPCPIIRDLESRMPTTHIYRDNDPITWAHETTHGLNSRIRNQLMNDGRRKINAIYHGGEYFSPFQDSGSVTLTHVMNAVPPSLMEDSMKQLYFIEGSRYWDDTPSYVYDELSAYINGSAARYQCGIQSRGETVLHMLEFLTYTICYNNLAVTNGRSLNEETKLLNGYLIKRVVVLLGKNVVLGGCEQALQYLSKMVGLDSFMTAVDNVASSGCREILIAANGGDYDVPEDRSERRERGSLPFLPLPPAREDNTANGLNIIELEPMKTPLSVTIEEGVGDIGELIWDGRQFIVRGVE